MINFQEEYSSQLPALRMLINAGYTYLNNDEVMQLRGNKTDNVLLEPIVKKQLALLNNIQVSSIETAKFTESNIEEAILKLKDIPLTEGYISATEYIYQLLTLGTTLSQTIGGNKREYTLQYVDWKHIENNTFHIAEEYTVKCTDGKKELRPDIVLFVNGIPLVVIENKREDMKNPIKQAISQHLRNQQVDRIRKLYVYAQILVSCAVGKAKYATNGTTEEFWNAWREKEFSPLEIEQTKNKSISKEVIHKIIERRKSSPFFTKEKAELIYSLLTENYQTTEQDFLLYALACPDRLLNWVLNYILYDNGIKKIARYQQFFAIKKTLQQIKGLHTKKREGGVIWHTQGSGKSLTMALMAEAIAREKTIKNPKIILVTDRTDLDRQITTTFKNVGLEVMNAKTGQKLVDILQSNTDAVITTIINKFETAVGKIKEPLLDNNVFVLIDEAHRTQHGSFNINMQKTMPNACYIAFTGTPLFKKKKSTEHKFGIMLDKYTVKEAVEDGAVLPLIYEGRFADQDVNKEIIDRYFEMVSEPLTQYEKADLKKKFSKRSHIADADQNIYTIAWDISNHFTENFQGTPFKGQLVCSTKRTAVKYYNYLKQIGKVSCELVISAPDDREGEESPYGETAEEVKSFWKKMLDQHGNSKRYEENIIKQFKDEEKPELIIVVDKLLTGFDAPKNTVLYLTRKLREHTLLQAIARVNRVFPDKDYGYIIDYAGVVEELNDALLVYSDIDENYTTEDMEGTLTQIESEIEKLDPAHQELLAIFKSVKNSNDLESYQQCVREKDVRDNFYKRLAAYARILKLALSSIDFHKNTADKKIKTYKDDLKFFMNLRTMVAQRFSDVVDYSQYEGQIQKLIDQHITTKGIEKLTDLVNVFDENAFQKEVEKTVGASAKADKIASRTAKHITEKLDEDPVFYTKFSKLIQQAIDDFYQQRISELEYLEKMKEYREKVLSRTDESIPEKIRSNKTVSAYFGIVQSFYKDKNVNIAHYDDFFADAVLQIEQIIAPKKVVNWQNNTDVHNKILLEVGDYILDEIAEQIEVKISIDEAEKIAEQILSVAITRA